MLDSGPSSTRGSSLYVRLAQICSEHSSGASLIHIVTKLPQHQHEATPAQCERLCDELETCSAVTIDPTRGTCALYSRCNVSTRPPVAELPSNAPVSYQRMRSYQDRFEQVSIQSESYLIRALAHHQMIKSSATRHARPVQCMILCEPASWSAHERYVLHSQGRSSSMHRS